MGNSTEIPNPLVNQLPTQHDLVTEPIPPDLELRPGLVKIVVVRTDALGEITKFALPVQWEKSEAAELIFQIRGLHWQLSNKDNLPGDYEGIRDLCNSYLHKKVGYVKPIGIKTKKNNREIF